MIRHLTAILTVSLIAVIFCGVVAGGDHDTCLTLEITYQIAEDGSGLKLACDIGFDAVRG